MDEQPHAWGPPESDRTASTSAGAPLQFVPGSPLGGAEPLPTFEPPKDQRRELTMAGLLLVYAIVAGAASLMPWRDYGLRIGATVDENGWRLPGGGFGRGWIAVLLALFIAAAGLLIVVGQVRIGRVIAVLSGVGLMILAIAGWGIGAGRLASGPGIGLWIEFIVGALVVGTVGILGSPPPEPDD